MHPKLLPIAKGYRGSCRYGKWKGFDVLDCTSDSRQEGAFRGQLIVHIVVGDVVFSGWIPSSEFGEISNEPWKLSATVAPKVETAPRKRLSLKERRKINDTIQTTAAEQEGKSTKRARLSLRRKRS